ncbi:MFS general substrate transporter [Lindgomyces ingoldianus]|uniref:MFS general substrate transporter n=1 Tax=Lindgomyces ingoldianus TaxID=673940 RepID=A0ACB6QGW0_9PLEO|nr:MFS general substrate transporter [Lindgomyces ingoldianus]KAF2466259.1 MFS general substrate transporter [Lindgomyces ingoldianus]
MSFISRQKPPVLFALRSSNAFTLTAICLAAFTDGFLYAVVVPVLPFSLENQSGIPERDIQKWSSYLLTAFGGALSALAGWIANRGSSRRMPFLLGLLLQAFSTSLFLVSPRVEILLVARALQGLSSAVVYSVGLALLVDIVGMDEIGRNAGYFLSSANMGVMVSPLAGGILYARAGYCAVAIMMVSLVVVDILLRLVMIEKSVAAKWEQDEDEESDLHRAILAGSQIYGLIDDQRHQVKTNTPTMLRILMSLRALADLYAVFVSYTLLAAFDAGLGVFVKERFHWGSSAAGAIFLAIALPSLLSPVGGSLSDKYGPKWIAVMGFGVAATALFTIGFIEKPSFWGLSSLYALLMLIGSSIAFILPCVADDLTQIAQTLSSPFSGYPSGRGMYAQSFALFNCGIAGGRVIGPLWVSAASRFGWQVVTALMGGLALSACVSIAMFHKDASEAEQETDTIAE